MPLQIIRIYAKTVLCVKVMPIKKMAKNTTPTNALSRLPYLSEKGPANGKAINRPRPTAAMIAITLLTSKLLILTHNRYGNTKNEVGDV